MQYWKCCIVFITLFSYNRTTAASPANLTLTARLPAADAFIPTPGSMHAHAAVASSPITSADTAAKNRALFGTSKAVCSDPDTMRDCSDDCALILDCEDMSFMYNCSVDGLNCYKTDYTFPTCSRLSQCGGPIICAEAGQFPDPDSCTKHHSCAGINVMSTVEDCPDGEVYNMTSRLCEAPTASCDPDGPVPTCLTDTQNGPLADNASYYYKCETENSMLYPALYFCSDDYEYVNDVGCVLITTPGPTTTMRHGC